MSRHTLRLYRRAAPFLWNCFVIAHERDDLLTRRILVWTASLRYKLTFSLTAAATNCFTRAKGKVLPCNEKQNANTTAHAADIPETKQIAAPSRSNVYFMRLIFQFQMIFKANVF